LIRRVYEAITHILLPILLRSIVTEQGQCSSKLDEAVEGSRSAEIT
jgi:hypothetical protein